MVKLIKGVKQLTIVWETLTSNDKASLCGLKGSSASPVEKARACWLLCWRCLQTQRTVWLMPRGCQENHWHFLCATMMELFCSVSFLILFDNESSDKDILFFALLKTGSLRYSWQWSLRMSKKFSFCLDNKFIFKWVNISNKFIICLNFMYLI